MKSAIFWFVKPTVSNLANYYRMYTIFKYYICSSIMVVNMSTAQKSNFAKFVDNLWLQLGIATAITFGWLVWVAIEILVRG